MHCLAIGDQSQRAQGVLSNINNMKWFHRISGGLFNGTGNKHLILLNSKLSSQLELGHMGMYRIETAQLGYVYPNRFHGSLHLI